MAGDGAPRRRASVVDWMLRIVLALFFVYQGVDKFGSRPLWIRLFTEIGIGQWFRYATGAVEIAGGMLLLVPKVTAVAVVMLACTMVGALLVHVFVIGIGPQSVFVGVLLMAILSVGWRRRAALTRPVVKPPVSTVL